MYLSQRLPLLSDLVDALDLGLDGTDVPSALASDGLAVLALEDRDLSSSNLGSRPPLALLLSELSLVRIGLGVEGLGLGDLVVSVRPAVRSSVT